MELATLESVQVLHSDVLDAEFGKLLAQVGDSTLVRLVQFGSDGLYTSLVILRNLEGVMFIVLIKSFVVCLLLGIYFK